MTVIIHFLLFETIDKIFIKFIVYLLNDCRIKLIICLNVFFFSKIFEN